MRREQEFEQRLADWLEDGPQDAPDGAVTSAVVFARAHPRRRTSLGGLWRTVMHPTQPAPFPSPAHRSRLSAFAAVAVVAAVALAVVGGGALLLGGGPASVPVAGPAATATPAPTVTPAPAAASDEALVADLAAVWNSPYDATRVAALYAPDARFVDNVAGKASFGLEAIQEKARNYAAIGFKLTNTSAPIRQGDFVAVFVKFGAPEAANPGLVLYRLRDGKVVGQWAYDAASPAASSPAASSPSAVSDEALVADLAAVWSDPYDAAKVATLYAPDAVVRELTAANATSLGLEEIGARIRGFNVQKFTTVVTSPVIRQDAVIAAFSTYGTGGDLSGRALVVYALEDGKVVNHWVYPAP